MAEKQGPPKVATGGVHIDESSRIVVSPGDIVTVGGKVVQGTELHFGRDGRPTNVPEGVTIGDSAEGLAPPVGPIRPITPSREGAIRISGVVNGVAAGAPEAPRTPGVEIIEQWSLAGSGVLRIGDEVYRIVKDENGKPKQGPRGWVYERQS